MPRSSYRENTTKLKELGYYSVDNVERAWLVVDGVLKRNKTVLVVKTMSLGKTVTP